MFGKTDKDWKQFHDLTDIIENTPPKQVPDHFTSKLMKRLPAEQEMVQSFSFKNLFPTYLDFGFQNTVTKTECAFYFVLTGFFYFILGFMMAIGIPLPAIIHDNHWLSFQPLFGLLLAVELMAIGFLFYKKGESAIRIVRIGTVLYAALVILNFWIATFYVHVPIVILCVAIFSITALCIAFLLGLAIEHYRQVNIFSEICR
jgi:ABC-type multidrug transport system permease subunit